MTCADHQGAAQNMADVGNVALATSSSGGAAAPMDPDESGTAGTMVEQHHTKQQHFLHQDLERVLILPGGLFLGFFGCCCVAEYWMPATMAASQASLRFLSQGRALIGGGLDLLGAQLGRLLGHRLLLALVQLDEDLDVFPEVRLRAHEDDGGFGAVAPARGHPLLVTFWKEEGLTTQKHSRKMSALV
ncbi:hypothetical protein MDA_GLEAN10007985 [Myotis davidii]|uniref:Uncharacterized protein n=1 Tax=Myotis davidii TaxID=225400 RepID=L5MGQ7_MYODS|nr:hypothetical protein MDA_GLEAN10007985 [Myotis davidii]